MKAIRSWGGSFACVFALSLLAPANGAASSYEIHALPELGTCKEVAKGAGSYRGAHCVTVASAGKGKFEWTPTGASSPVSGTASAMLLESAGHPSLKCGAATITGEWTGPKAANLEMELTNCANSAGEKCQSSPLTESVIKTSPLEAQLGVFSKSGHLKGGLDFKPKSPSTALMTYQCAVLTEMVHVEGSVIARLQTIDKMTSPVSLMFVVRKGVQEPQKFESEPKDTLTSSFMTGLETTSAPSLLSFASASLRGASPLEVKAREHH